MGHPHHGRSSISSARKSFLCDSKIYRRSNGSNQNRTRFQQTHLSASLHHKEKEKHVMEANKYLLTGRFLNCPRTSPALCRGHGFRTKGRLVFKRGLAVIVSLKPPPPPHSLAMFNVAVAIALLLSCCFSILGTAMPFERRATAELVVRCSAPDTVALTFVRRS